MNNVRYNIGVFIIPIASVLDHKIDNFLLAADPDYYADFDIHGNINVFGDTPLNIRNIINRDVDFVGYVIENNFKHSIIKINAKRRSRHVR